MTNFNSVLNDGDLDLVSGGTDRKTTIAVAATFVLASQALGALGDAVGSAYYAGRAMGVMDVGSPKCDPNQ
ncbi:hypothetical protein [Bradyrhizobium sp. JYMT SZCCT0428]|uniref:hypothetical protein n=1 Tax=Bradyrhizobium sp. JYMT SZCCT0428 TaxID=2807673 RepID=UPI001BA84142|nr:hypothetical protein [Bradyrhizobium sp. JYMT SZCCT0428]MBR1153702.1 hypothetical protein [Bradyrhizobium sp. JYMT SZCCT0428]